MNAAVEEREAQDAAWERSKANHSIAGKFSGLDGRVISVRQERCAKVRNRNVDCLKCAQACTSGCISLVGEELIIDAEKCVGCGTCATVCPTCALEARHPNDAALLGTCRQSMRDGVAHIACAQAAEALRGMLDESAFAQVVCLGRVDESLICELVAAGAREVRLLCGTCGQCAQHYGRETAEKVIETARTLLETWQSDARVVIDDEPDADIVLSGCTKKGAKLALSSYFSVERGNPPVSELLGATPDEGELSSDELLGHDPSWSTAPQELTFDLLHVMADGTLPHFVPDRRERLLDALAAIGEPKKGEAIETRLWGYVAIDGSKCTACRMCATFCPTGAIRKFDDPDGTFGVEHYPGDCVKCRSCEDICLGHAIKIVDKVRSECLVDGSVHRYPMKHLRPTEEAHQILQTMAKQTEGDIYER